MNELIAGALNRSNINMKPSPAFCRIFPFAIYIGFLVFESIFSFLKTKGFDLLGNLDENWHYPIKILLVTLAILWLWRHFTELAIPFAIKWLDLLTGIVVGVIVFVLWINLDQSWAVVGHSAGYNPTDPLSHQIDWMLVAIRIFGAAVIVPLIEELFWRSFIMRWLEQQHFLEVDPAKVGFKAFFITAVLFASEHNLILAGLLAGFAYNWLYIRTRNLWIPVVAHSVTNGLLGLWVINTHNWQFW